MTSHTAQSHRITLTALGTVAAVLALTACGGAQPQPAPSTSATSTTSTTDPVSPLENGITVMGSLKVLMAQTTPDSVVPAEPLSYALLVDLPGSPVPGTFPVAPDGTFALALPEGHHKLEALEIRSPSFGRDPIFLPIRASEQVVLHAPGRDCVWGGEISVTYGRLPAGSEKQQEAQVRRASENNHQNYAYVYRADGGFVLAGALVRRTAPADRPAATQVCADELFNWVAV